MGEREKKWGKNRGEFFATASILVPHFFFRLTLVKLLRPKGGVFLVDELLETEINCALR